MPEEASNSDQEEWDELELGETNMPLSEANYFEKAQSFKEKIKKMRIDYLGLTPKLRKDKDGNLFRVYVKDKTKQPGINKIGVIENIQFLEDRLGNFTVLTSWSEDRMFHIMKDDMETWFFYLMRNWERWEITPATALGLRSTINDLLEMAYRRGVEDAERKSMTPGVNILERLGFLKPSGYDSMNAAQTPTQRLKDEMQRI